MLIGANCLILFSTSSRCIWPDDFIFSGVSVSCCSQLIHPLSTPVLTATHQMIVCFQVYPSPLQYFRNSPDDCIFSGVSVGVSCFTLLSISLERYFAICRPLHSRRWQTLSHAYKMIGAIWVLSLLFMIPIAVHTRHIRVRAGLYICREIWTVAAVERAYTVFLDVCLLVLPLVVMSGAYGCVIYTLWNGVATPQRDTGM